MNKQFVISVVVSLVLLMAFGSLVHGVLLDADYSQLQVQGVYRSDDEQMKRFPLMLVAQLLTAIALVWVYQRGKEAKPPLAQGIRYGLAVAALMIIAKFLIYYIVMPIPESLMVKQIVFDTIAIVVVSIVVAHLNQ